MSSYDFLFVYTTIQYEGGTGNTSEDKSSFLPQSKSASCNQQGHANSKTLLQQNPPGVNRGPGL